MAPLTYWPLPEAPPIGYFGGEGKPGLVSTSTDSTVSIIGVGDTPTQSTASHTSGTSEFWSPCGLIYPSYEVTPFSQANMQNASNAMSPVYHSNTNANLLCAGQEGFKQISVTEKLDGSGLTK